MSDYSHGASGTEDAFSTVRPKSRAAASRTIFRMAWAPACPFAHGPAGASPETETNVSGAAHLHGGSALGAPRMMGHPRARFRPRSKAPAAAYSFGILQPLREVGAERRPAASRRDVDAGGGCSLFQGLASIPRFQKGQAGVLAVFPWVKLAAHCCAPIAERVGFIGFCAGSVQDRFLATRTVDGPNVGTARPVSQGA